MPVRESNWPEGTPCWVDLGVLDINRARAFYTAVFGWDIPEGSPESGGYAVASLHGHNVAGLGPQQGPPDAAPIWTVYLASDDLDATVAKVKGAGGQLIMEPMDVMESGRMAVAIDTAGAPFGLWQGRRHTGAELVNAPGAQTWNEILSQDYEAAQAVFGYEYEEVEGAGLKYSAFKINGQYAGGIGEAPPGAPDGALTAWRTYFGAADTDETLGKVIEQGGSTISEPHDSPYGRTAVVTDDQGAIFNLISVTPAP
jgi:predicted enzyme related to lactoylglutathione lyase